MLWFDLPITGGFLWLYLLATAAGITAGIYLRDIFLRAIPGARDPMPSADPAAMKFAIWVLIGIAAILAYLMLGFCQHIYVAHGWSWFFPRAIPGCVVAFLWQAAAGWLGTTALLLPGPKYDDSES